jgi:zinc transporter ZupT
MALVIFFERYLVTRLYFVETFFKTDDNSLIPTETHDHHHDTDLSDAKDCVHSHQQGHQHAHQHSHVHQHTHLEVMGKGEVCSAIACFMICSFFDGIALASVQVVNAKLGLLLVIGVVLHLLPEGILSGAMALAGGANLKSAQKILFFIGGAFVLGSLIPFIFHGFEYTFLALSSGIILFVTMVQLLPTALRLNYAPLWISSGILLYLGSHAVLSGIGVSI